MTSGQESRRHARTVPTAGTVSRFAQQRVDERVREIMSRRSAGEERARAVPVAPRRGWLRSLCTSDCTPSRRDGLLAWPPAGEWSAPPPPSRSRVYTDVRKDAARLPERTGASARCDGGDLTRQLAPVRPQRAPAQGRISLTGSRGFIDVRVGDGRGATTGQHVVDAGCHL